MTAVDRLIKVHDRIWKQKHIPFDRRAAASRALQKALARAITKNIRAQSPESARG
jgi:hypothetical protein